jgi:hypothetical protein
MTLLFNTVSVKFAKLNSVTGHLTPSGTSRVVLLHFELNAIILLVRDRVVESGFGPHSKGGRA